MISARRVPAEKGALSYLCEFIKENKLDGKRVCVVVPTVRNVRKLSATEFESVEIFSVKDFARYANEVAGVLIPKQLRPYYLKKTAEKLPRDAKLTIFKKENSVLFESFSSFLQASSGIIALYRELASELIDKSSLFKASKYTDYELELNVLETLWQNYIAEIKKAGLDDEWESFKNPQYSENFIKRYDHFIFLIAGYLTKYEMMQLKNLSSSKEVTLIFNHAGKKNKQHEIYEKELGVEIENRELKKLDNSSLAIFECASDIAQFDLVINEAYKIKQNYKIDFSKMVVIMPDDKLKSYFLRLDKYNLFDISANEDISACEFYSILQMVINLKKETEENKSIAPKITSVINILQSHIIKNHFEVDEKIEKLIKFIEKGRIFIKISELYDIDFFKIIAFDIINAKNKLKFGEACETFRNYLVNIAKISPEKESAIISEAISKIIELEIVFRNINDEFSFSEASSIILSELAALRLDTPKGKMPVIGLLESRNMDFEVVFIPFMNEDIFPPSSKKDMFLNTEIRKELDLPTFNDRQNLLKNYFLQSIEKAGRTIITYKKNNNSRNRSPFLDELALNNGIKIMRYNPHQISVLEDDNAAKFYFNKNNGIVIQKNDDILKSLASVSISASAFNELVSCSLKFYFRRVARLSQEVEAAEETLSSKFIGTAFHKTFERVYNEKIEPTDKDYEKLFIKYFKEEINKSDAYLYSIIEHFKADNIIKTIPLILKTERERFADGFRTFAREKKYEANFCGYKLNGKIDKIEQNNGQYEIIDYKFKAIQDADCKVDFERRTDWQLPFYALLLELGENVAAKNIYYFDLKEDFELKSAFDMAFFDNFKEFLKEKLALLSNKDEAFSQTDDIESCRYCEFKTICGRDIF